MRHIMLIVIIHFVSVLNGNGQQRLNWLKENLIHADSVLIVSHEATTGMELIDEKGNVLPMPKLVVNNKLNSRIVHEKKTLADTAIHRLSDILIRPFQDSLVVTAKCFIPHHAIVFYRGRHIHYIDICFGCMKIGTSGYVGVTEEDFDRRKWKELRTYFRQHGLKYELSETEENN